MTSQYRHRRTSIASATFPTLEPGEIAVNTANRQVALGDAQTGVVGAPLLMIPVRYYDARAQYAVGDMVARSGQILRAKVTITPSAFNAANWENIIVDVDLTPYLPKAGGVMTGPLTLAAGSPSASADAAPKLYIDTAIAQRVLKAGDIMSGHLSLPTGPAAANAVRKDYVDGALALKSSVIVSDTAPAGAIDATLWYKSDVGKLLLRYNDGDSVQWVEAVAIPAPDMTWAAPFDAMAYSGMQVNGSMEVSQENGTAPFVVNPKTYIVDGWLAVSNGTQVLNAGQTVQGPVGFGYSAQIWVATVNAAPAAGHYAFFSHRMEGYRTNRLGWGTASAQPITIGFWMYVARPGTYYGSLRGGAGTRSYVFPITATNAWTYSTVTVPGCVDGTWDKANAGGIELSFAMMAGSTYQTATPNVWAAGNFLSITGAVNGVAATTDTMYVTGVTILPGTAAPTAAQSSRIMRPFDQELLTCQRYYEKSGAKALSWAGWSYSTVNSILATSTFSVIKRAVPTMTFADDLVFNFAAGAVFAGGTATTTGIEVERTPTVAAGAYCYFMSSYIADARL